MTSVSRQELTPTRTLRSRSSRSVFPSTFGVPPRAKAPHAPSKASSRVADLQFSQALCARMCHDLMGPAGAISIGLDFLDDGAATDTEALELVAASARQLKARLVFFRVAFGLSGGQGDVSLSEAQAIADGFLGGGRVSLRWTGMTEDQADSAPAHFADFIRLVLCLAMVAAETLPRGGELVVHLDRRDGRSLARLTAQGTGIRLSNDTLRALEAADTDGPTARAFHVHYAKHLAAMLGAPIQFNQPNDNELIFEAELTD